MSISSINQTNYPALVSFKSLGSKRKLANVNKPIKEIDYQKVNKRQGNIVATLALLFFAIGVATLGSMFREYSEDKKQYLKTNSTTMDIVLDNMRKTLEKEPFDELEAINNIFCIPNNSN